MEVLLRNYRRKHLVLDTQHSDVLCVSCGKSICTPEILSGDEMEMVLKRTDDPEIRVWCGCGETYQVTYEVLTGDVTVRRYNTVWLEQTVNLALDELRN